MVTLAIFFSGMAYADNSGVLFINSNNSEAKLLINEAIVDGELSKLFDQMKIDETRTETKKIKTFQMSNGRFSLICNKGFFISSPPSTSCTFTIKSGENTSDINTFISKTSGQKVATVRMTQVFSKELDSIFPADSSGLTNYLFKTENGVSLEANGATWGNFTIEFSGQ